MPTVEKVSGGRVLVRGIGRFDVGDTADVSASDAAYLCEEREDFRRVGGEYTDGESESGDAETGDSGGSTADATDGSENDAPDGTCAATTADDEPCSNPAGEDGYCHLASHGPEA